MRDQNWLNSIPIFGIKLELPKIQNKIMGGLHMVVRVSMKIHMIFGIVKMPHLSTLWFLLHFLPYLKAMNKSWSK